MLAVTVALLLSLTPVKGGNCWSGMTRGGRCTDLLQEKATREQCCAQGGQGGQSSLTAWSEQDMDAGTMFFWRVLGGGVPCQACRDSCAGVSCGPGRRCAVRWGRPQCVCSPECAGRARAAKQGAKQSVRRRLSALASPLSPQPPRPRGPVCGSDGRSYRSTCRLLKRACRQADSNLAVDYHGTCQSSCERVHCGPGRSCVQDQNLAPHCVRCERHCPSAGPGRPVCGADGSTYPSVCHLREAACRAGKAIPVAYRGHCQRVASCGAVPCRRHQTCLTDLASGAPRCVTCSLRCRGSGASRASKASKRHGGARRAGRHRGARVRELLSLDGPDALDALDGLVQGAALSPDAGPVCGSNNRTYASWCHMRKDACATGFVIDTRHAGACAASKAKQGKPKPGQQAGAEPAPHLNTVL